jgi:hypothetical protein
VTISRIAAMAFFEAFDEEWKERAFEHFRMISPAFVDVIDAMHQAIEDTTMDFIAAQPPEAREELERMLH